jgi:predicted Zn-dependent protease
MTAPWRTLAAVCATAHLPALVVTVEGDPAADASVALGPPCHGSPVLGIAAHLLSGDDQIAAACVAHEVAHLHLGHPRAGWHRYLGEVLATLGAAAGVAWVLGRPVWAAAALAVAAVVLVAGKARCRRAEVAADHHGAVLLEAAGMDGHTAMTAMLADLAAGEHRAHAAVWWLCGHPPAARRLAALAGATSGTITTTNKEIS